MVFPGRYTISVVVLLAFVLLLPFTGVGTISNTLLNFTIILMLLAVSAGNWRSRALFYLTAALAFLSLMPFWGIPETRGMNVVSHTASVLFLVLVTAGILSHVLASERVTVDTVFGAACVYLIIGLLWGSIFALLEFWAPGSLRLPQDGAGAAKSALAPLLQDTIILYYSFETLTTIGYGDVTPLSVPARFLSVCEALVGQLYMAILVARFVALQVSHSPPRAARPPAEGPPGRSPLGR